MWKKEKNSKVPLWYSKTKGAMIANHYSRGKVVSYDAMIWWRKKGGRSIVNRNFKYRRNAFKFLKKYMDEDKVK